jgi:hypothetical protein
MSKRRKKAERLRLDSPNWIPAPEAHRLLTGLLGNPCLAAKDLTDAVAAKRSDKRLPCMRRLIASEVAPHQDRKIVPLSFRFDPVSEKLRVWDPEDDAPVYLGTTDAGPVYLGPAPPVYGDRADVAFFVWRPKFEKIWPGVAASAPARSSPAGIEAPPPRPRGSPRTHDWFSICGEIARLCVKCPGGGVRVPENQSVLVNQMLRWLDDQNLTPPAASEMAEAVRRVCAAMSKMQRIAPENSRFVSPKIG